MTNGINVLRNASTYITFSENDHITKVSPCIALGFMLFVCRTGPMILIHKGTGAIVHQNQPKKSNSFDRSSETQQHPTLLWTWLWWWSICWGSLLFNSSSSYWNILVFCKLWYWQYSVLFCMSHVFNSARSCGVLGTRITNEIVIWFKVTCSSESCYWPIM